MNYYHTHTNTASAVNVANRAETTRTIVDARRESKLCNIGDSAAAAAEYADKAEAAQDRRAAIAAAENSRSGDYAAARLAEAEALELFGEATALRRRAESEAARLLYSLAVQTLGESDARHRQAERAALAALAHNRAADKAAANWWQLLVDKAAAAAADIGEAERAEAAAARKAADDDAELSLEPRYRLWVVFSYESDAETDYCDWLADVDAEAAAEQALGLRSYCRFARAYSPSELHAIADAAQQAAADIGDA